MNLGPSTSELYYNTTHWSFWQPHGVSTHALIKISIAGSFLQYTVNENHILILLKKSFHWYNMIHEFVSKCKCAVVIYP